MKNLPALHPLPRPLKAAAAALLPALCILPGLYFSFVSLQEPWTTVRIARAVYSQEGGRLADFITALAGYRFEHIGGDMLQVALLKMSGWLPEAIGLLPLGSLLLAFMYYALSMQLSGSPWASAAIAVYASWYYPMLNSQYATQTYTWTHLIFLGFLYLLYKWIHRRTLGLSLLLLVLFISAFLYYHTTPLWMAVALTAAIGGLKISESRNPGERRAQAPATWSLALFCIVFYFSFDTVIYGNGLARLASGVVGETFLQSFYSKIIVPLLFHKSQALQAFAIAPVNPRLSTWTTLAVLLILTVPVSMWVTYKFYRVARRRSLSEAVAKPDDIFIWMVICVAVSHALIYTAYGAVSFRVVPIAFPLLLPLIVKEFRGGARWGHLLPFSLAACAVLGFIGFAPTLKHEITASETGAAAQLFQPGERILADPNTYASLLINSAAAGKIIDFAWPDSQRYASLVGLEPLQPGFDAAVLDSTANPVISSAWIFYEPWSRNLARVDGNPALSKVYDSEYLQVYRPAASSLPRPQALEAASPGPGSDFLARSIRILLTVAALILLPGAVAVYIAGKYSPLFAGDPNFMGAMILCLSVSFVTFTGYLANYVGLQYFIPLVVSIPLAILALFALYKRPKTKMDVFPASITLALITALFVWSFAAVAVKDIREETRSQFTEFFLTQGGDNPDALILGVVTHLDHPGQFKIVAKSGEEIIPLTGRLDLQPGAVYTHAPALPEELRGSRIQVILLRDGAPYRELTLTPVSDRPSAE